MDNKLYTPQIKKIIAENIKRYDIPVHKLAQMADLSNSEMLKIIRGDSMPSIDTLRKLSIALNVSIDSLIEQQK